MSEEENAKTSGMNVEVSVGWNSPPPKLNFPESVDSGDVSVGSVHSVSENPKYQNLKPHENPNTDILGIYSGLLPGSSPPRPRLKVRKRKPESPLRHREPSISDSLESARAIPPLATSLPSTDSKRRSNAQCTPVPQDLDLSSDDSDSPGLRAVESKPSLLPAPSMAALNSDSDSDSDSDLEDLIKITQPLKYSETYYSSRKILRFVVQNLEISGGGGGLVLRVTDSKQDSFTVILKGSWSDTMLKRGDTIHILRFKGPSTVSVEFITDGVLEVTDQNDLCVVVNPDILVSCTSVAEALSCERQVILRNQVRVPSDLNENLVLGSIKHEFIQACFTVNCLNDRMLMESLLKTAIDNNSVDLQLVDSDCPSALNKLLPIIPEIQKWALTIWGPRAAGRLVDFHGSRESFKVRVNKTAYIEEEVRSPYLGLIGKIDVTCEATDVESYLKTSKGSRLVGLEIKTGKSTQSISHRAQTALYTLLLAERHPFNTHPWSLLYYTETSTTIAVQFNLLETRALLQKRNKVAFEMWHLPMGKLPAPTPASDAICNWCSRSNSCILYTAIVDGGDTNDSSALTTIYNKARDTGILTPVFLKFIEHWHSLLELEYETHTRSEQLMARQWWLNSRNPVLWSIGETSTPNTATLATPTEGNVYVMEAATDLRNSDEPTEFKPGDFIVISNKQHMGITFGVIVACDFAPLRLTICVQDKLLPSGKYRIDSELFSSDAHLGLARYNLNNLTEHDRLRELVVYLREPKFAEPKLNSRKFQFTVEWASSKVLSGSQDHTRASQNNGEDGESDMEIEDSSMHKNLNEDQTKALNKVLTAKDYALILGMPGTGKTTTIAAIVASLVKRGKTVLLSAYTNSAVDTLVLKLSSVEVPCLRLASTRTENIHPDVRPVTVSGSGAASSAANLTRFLECPVIACTSHSASHKLFALRKFDYCILDEASQITLPFVLGPLRLATKFVLVGDHYQLPPLVRNQQAKELGLTESLFKILCDTHPSAVVDLKMQYRMCASIMSLSSDLVYDGRLVCGSRDVAEQKLQLNMQLVDPHYENLVAVDPENCVVFLNTDKLGMRAYERTHQGGSSNMAEAQIIQKMVQQFAQAEYDLRNLAVISVYRQQLSVLTELLSTYVARGLEILTADQAQGRDKCCIIVSLVKSNERSASGELLKDWRRLNVAFTRAKEKLVIIGSERTMQRADGVSSFFQHIQRRGWVHDAQLDSTPALKQTYFTSSSVKTYE